MSDLVISSSSLGIYITCKKMYELGYERLLEPIQGEGPMSRGTEFHRFAEWSTRMAHENLKTISTPEQLEMPQVSETTKEIYSAWCDNRGREKEKSKKRILGVETPIFVPLNVVTDVPGQKVYLRCTFDQIYLDADDWIVGLDYKTTVKMDTWDVDLDFQGRLYIAALSVMFPGYNVRFQYERVRQAPPGSPRGESQNLRFTEGEWWQYNPAGTKRKRAALWTVDECYQTIDLVCSDHEIKELWDETNFNASEMVVRRSVARTMPGAWPRSTNKLLCRGCYFKELCKSDLQGTLDEDTIKLLAVYRNPLVLPISMLPTEEATTA